MFAHAQTTFSSVTSALKKLDYGVQFFLSVLWGDEDPKKEDFEIEDDYAY